MIKNKIILRSSVFSSLILIAASISAQQLQPLETVANRSRPALDPLGIRVRSFVFLPSLIAEGLYHDNIFADESITVDDIILSVRPELTFESDWNNHSLRLLAEADLGRYQDNDEEDYDDHSMRADGRLDLSRNTYLAGYVAHSEGHEERTSVEDTADASLTELSVTRASLTYFRNPNRLFLRLNTSLRDTDYDDARTPTEIINNDDRDRRVLEHGIRIGYEFVPDASLYLEGTANSWEYDQRIDDNGIERGSDGYEIVLGASRMISGVSSASAFVGFRSQDMDDARFETADGISFGAEIAWNITNLITLNADARRTIEPTTLFNASSIDATRFGVTIDYELLRRLIISADIRLAKDDYEGLDREDEVFGYGIGMKFMLNRRLHVYIGYGYERREVTPQEFGDDNYRINTAFISLRGQL